MAHVYTNNASTLIAAGISASDTQVTAAAGQGALFPSPTGGNIAKATLEDVLGNIEIVHITARSGDTLTIARAQEGTTGKVFPSGSRLELRVTRGVLEAFFQKAGDVITGTADLSVGGILNGGRYQNGEIVASPIRGSSGQTNNQVTVPSDGTAPRVGPASSQIYHDDNAQAKVSALNIATTQLTGDMPNARIIVGNVTQHQAALSITEAQIVNGALLARLNEANTFTAGQAVAMVAMADGVTLTPDCNLGNSFRTVLGGNRTLAAPTNPRSGMVITFVLRQDGTGTRTIVWDSIYKHASGLDPVLSTAPNAVDSFSFIYDDVSAVWLASGLGLA